MRLGEWHPVSLFARVRSLWRGLRKRDAVEAEMVAEFRHHLELRTEDLMRGGLTREQAARQAHIEFGHVEGHRIDARSARGLRPFDQLRFSTLDVKLGVRMAAKHPGLSLVAVVGMSMAIAIALTAFSVITSILEPALPLPDGGRVVAVRNALITEPGQHSASSRDFSAWRDELKSVEDLAAFTTADKNLLIPGAGADLVRVARMTASGFKVARTAPIRGRPLVEQDERNDARVLVIAFEEWQRRFGADQEIIGRRVRLGTDEFTIVGVMPEGFRFPVDDHYWIPLNVGPAEREIAVTVFGRLAEGATLQSAQAELTTIGTRMAAAYPETHERLRPRVLSYTRAFFDIQSPGQVWRTQLIQLFVGLLLVVIAVNVAVLVYARTATRAGEIAVRTALGASRARVVTQLFAEALVLSGVASAIGLALAHVVLVALQAVAAQRLGVDLPFWIKLGLSPGVIAYAVVLAIVGAAIVGVVPALRATGRRVQASLQQLSGHGARMQLGRAWTTLIIAQVAIAVAVLPFAVAFTRELIGNSSRDLGYAAEEFLEASLEMEGAAGDSSGASEQRFRARMADLIRRLESDPAVLGLTIRSPDTRERIELEDAAVAGQSRRIQQRVDRIDPRFFALYGMPFLAGRAFTAADTRVGATAVIVNQVFAEKHLGTGLAIGRRLRFVRDSDGASSAGAGPWYEIVGVVRDFEERRYEPRFYDRIYLPADVARLSSPISLAIHVRMRPATGFAPRIREITADVDPTLQIKDLVSAAERSGQAQQVTRYLAIGATAAMLSVVLLSAAGIYAMMSFTVARRRREIGIRSALGADSRHVLSSIFARASTQVGAGMLIGLVGTVTLDRVTGRGPVHDGNAIALVMVAALMTTVGLLAAVVPARRGLAVQPTEALREE